MINLVANRRFSPIVAWQQIKSVETLTAIRDAP
jgi:hypothetical protein